MVTTGHRIKSGTRTGLPTLASREPGWTSDTHELFVGDGSANHKIGPLAVSELTDATITSPAGGDLLTYDSGSGKWKNEPAPSSAPTLAVVTRAANYALATTGVGPVPWDDYVLDTGSYWSNGTPTQLAIAVTGIYEIAASAWIEDSGLNGFVFGDYKAALKVNGSLFSYAPILSPSNTVDGRQLTYASSPPDASAGYTEVSAQLNAMLVPLSTGDYIELSVVPYNQASGNALITQAWMSIKRIA